MIFDIKINISRRILVLICFFLMLEFATPSKLFGQHQTIVLNSTGVTIEDAEISMVNPTINYGSTPEISVMANQSTATPVVLDIERSVLKFDLSSIPENAVVVSAELKLTAQEVQNPNSFNFVFSRLAAGWLDNAINWSNQPVAHTSSDLVVVAPATSTVNTTFLVDVKDHVQNMVNYGFNNEGWQIRLEDETNTTNIDYGAVFYSTDHMDPNLRPELAIVYRMPLEVTGEVTHCSCDGPGNDGEITLSFSGGSGQYKSAALYKLEIDPTKVAQNIITAVVGYNNNSPSIGTGFTVSSLSPGLYMLQLVDNVQLPHSYLHANTNINRGIKHFLVGQGGVVTEVLMSNWQYVNQTVIGKYTGSLSGIEAEDVPYGLSWHNYLRASDYGTDVAGTPVTAAYHFASLLDFRVHFSPDVNVLSADLHLEAASLPYQQSNYSSNALKFHPIVEPWYHGFATWNFRPSVNSNIVVNLPATGTPNGNTPGHTEDIVNIMPFVNYWKANPANNYGVEIGMETYNVNNGKAHRNYKLVRPNDTHFRLSFTAVCGTADIEYVTLKRKLDGTYYDLSTSVEQILHLKYNEEYVDSDGLLNAKIYSSNRAEQNFPGESIQYGDNRLDIDVSGIAPGSYVLEVNNDKNEAFFLRFKK